MKIMLMDQIKLVNLILPKEVFGNYWVVNADKDNLVSVEAIDGNWILKSNSEIKVFKDGPPVNEIALEEEKFYTLKNVLLGQSYVIYTSPTYDKNTMQLCIGNIENAVYYIGNNNAPANGNVVQNIISYEQNGFARNQLKLTVQNGVYSVINLNPQMPMYINGLLKTQDYLKYGDSIFILGFKLSIVKDIFMVNNPNKLLKYDAKTFITRALPSLDFNKISKEVTTDDAAVADLQSQVNTKTTQSKKLGNWRTGLLAGNALTNVAGAVVAGKNKVDDDLQAQIEVCKAAVKNLKTVAMQAKLDGMDVSEADRIVAVCGEFDYVDVSKINNRGKGAMLSSAVGATTSVAGTIASVVANNNKTGKNLDGAANTLAGASTVASGVATVFNATQISAIKKVATVATQCSEVLK